MCGAANGMYMNSRDRTSFALHIRGVMTGVRESLDFEEAVQCWWSGTSMTVSASCYQAQGAWDPKSGWK